MFKLTSFAVVVALVSQVAAHGLVTSPPRRLPGNALKAACGNNWFNVVSGDQYGNVQAAISMKGSDYTSACKEQICKGLQFADNTGRVQRYSAGQTVNFQVDIRAPHTGQARVAVVNANTGALIGSPLISWTDYASNSHTIPQSEKSFSVTIPNLNGQCSTAGNCVLQWWWDAYNINQTYISCVDFTQ